MFWPVRRPFAITHHLKKGLNLYNKAKFFKKPIVLLILQYNEYLVSL